MMAYRCYAEVSWARSSSRLLCSKPSSDDGPATTTSSPADSTTTTSTPPAPSTSPIATASPSAVQSGGGSSIQGESPSTSATAEPVGLRRSFRDIIGAELASTMAALTVDTGRPAAPLPSELESLLSRKPLPPSPSRQDQRDARKSLVHPKYGFAALGGFVPDSHLPAAGSTPTAPASLFERDPKIHPLRNFLPGLVYDASDLNAYASSLPPKAASEKQRRAGRQSLDMPSALEVRKHADYKNVRFLERFVSPSSGRILHRRRTRLPIREQYLVSNCIKVARRMGLISAVARLDKRHLRGLREEELRVAQEKGLLA